MHMTTTQLTIPYIDHQGGAFVIIAQPTAHMMENEYDYQHHYL